MRRTLLVALVSSVLFAETIALPLLGCGAPSIEAQNPREYETRGTIRAIDAEHRMVTIAHEEVPGYMPAMTMPFELVSPAVTNGVSVGDRVRFRFRVESGGRHVVVTITRL